MNEVTYRDEATIIFRLSSSKYMNKFCVIDSEDYEKIKSYNWYANKDKSGKFYVVPVTKRGYKKVAIHRIIMDSGNMLVDHINGNTLDNRKANLRLCKNFQNVRNRGKQKNNTSGFKGVFWKKQSKKWYSAIRVNSKLIHLGYFDDVICAAKAYNKAATKYHGDFALINNLEIGE